MRIRVIAKAGAKHVSVQQTGEGEYHIAVREPPEQGKANRALAKALAAHLDIPVSALRLVHGKKGTNKVFEIPG